LELSSKNLVLPLMTSKQNTMTKNNQLSITNTLPIPKEIIERRIYFIRGQKVMLSADLAELYEVQVKVLNQAVKRNFNRFPVDFMFQINNKEFYNLKSQFVTSSWGGIRRALPYAFTEHGVAMLSAVLKSDRAVKMSILIVRAFIRLREILASNKDIVQKVKDLQRQQLHQGKKIDVIYAIVEKLIQTPTPPKKPIGFRTT
jgi:hypothetical protein